MEGFFRRLQRLLLLACVGLGVVAAVVGCHHACKDGQACKGGHGCGHGRGHGHRWGIFGFLDIDNCADIPKGAIPKPVGTFTNELVNRQVAKAERDDFVFYYNEWLDGQAVLGPKGSEHLDMVILRLRRVPFAVIVQPEPDLPVLNGQRQKALIDALVEAGYPEAPQRVFVGRPPAEGLFGEEAERIYPAFVRGGGGGVGGGAGLSGSFGGQSGFGGGFGNFGGFGGGFGFR